MAGVPKPEVKTEPVPAKKSKGAPVLKLGGGAGAGDVPDGNSPRRKRGGSRVAKTKAHSLIEKGKKEEVQILGDGSSGDDDVVEVKKSRPAGEAEDDTKAGDEPEDDTPAAEPSGEDSTALVPGCVTTPPGLCYFLIAYL